MCLISYSLRKHSFSRMWECFLWLSLSTILSKSSVFAEKVRLLPVSHVLKLSSIRWVLILLLLTSFNSLLGLLNIVDCFLFILELEGVVLLLSNTTATLLLPDTAIRYISSKVLAELRKFGLFYCYCWGGYGWSLFLFVRDLTEIMVFFFIMI